MFKITRRQYDIIMQQAQTAYSNECGGILGGKEDTILGVLPILNKDWSNPKKSYGLTSEDFERADAFFKKHKLEFLGVYHSHPKGIAFPSAQDLSHNMRHLFIIGLSDRYNPELAAFTVEDDYLIQEHIQIIDDTGASVIDIRTGQPKLGDNAMADEMQRLSEMITDIVNHQGQYQKQKPTWDQSSFSTLA